MEQSAHLYIVVDFLYSTILAGIAGTSGMTLFMYLITRSGLSNADMVRAIGSKLTQSLQSAFAVGIILHFVSGIIFAMLYTLAFNFLGLHGVMPLLGAGLGFGFLHGFVLSFILVTTVAEHHPLPEFRDAGLGVAVAHLVGHVVYGALVGMIIGLLGFTLL